MYVVVQTIQRKKPNKGGEYREYEVSSMSIQFQDGTAKTHHSYYPRYEAGRFDRPHLESYKISIHESRRENGKVVKKQCVVGTIDYYSLVEWGLFDYIDRGISHAVDVFGADYETLYRMVEDKMQPIVDKVKREFHRSPEYKARRQREKLEKAHQKAKKQFGEKYGVDPDEYDYCYNIFGELMDEQYLNRIIQQYEAARSYRESQRSSYREYRYSSYSVPSSSTYSDDDRAVLKKFYRELSKIYHPDLNPGVDTTAQMQVLNRLKEQWGV